MTRFVQGSGVELAVHEWGDPAKPTVLCVHGYPDDSSVWTDVAARLAEDFHVVAYDVRGAGQSTRPRARGDYHLDLLAADLVAVADAVSPAEPVHLLGHDWGSIQAWHAVTEPGLGSRFRSYTSVSGPCLDHAGHWLRDSLKPSPRRLGQLLRQLVFSAYIGFFQLPLLPELAWRTGALPRLMKRLVQLGDGAELPPPALADGLHGLQLYRANMVPRFRRPEQRRTGVPVQVLAPSRDPFVGAPVQASASRWVGDLRLRRIAGGHWLPRSRPEVIARCVREFATSVDGTAAETRGLRRARVLRPKKRWADHLVVITGGGSGIGRETALAFAEHGADVVVSDVDGDSARRTAELAELFGVTAAAHVVDVTDKKAVHAFAEDVRRELGVPDIVVNNAGIGMAGGLLDTSTEDWQRVLDVNLWGVIHGSRVFAEQLVERGEGGHLVNLASAAAYLHSRTLPAYATTKSAVLTLTQCLRAELAAHQIGVTAICPGIVNTNITKTTEFVGLSAAEQDRRRASTSALYRRRNYPPSKVAKAILAAVDRDKAIAPVTPEAHAGLLLSRLTPGLLRAAARHDLTPR
ncbi:NAD(P)-dependent dehydrogenase (short-subunit alcohol dehydrogenase family)/pimeloyl-ACP methyl ester carboxylesterase [Crossiella equi]|uniref:NAD(P)-dependent dehydrogenase (Short-subunit alcohol dehydrogenase family)/pimeloyl-ACP methyl ester carboxylesterase n=1 Tax=Crossiella equi TaxID=130796 RepID=A0ABS5AR44_9PSEU|nr:SDR family oxidoreductase [Crossiella equi]MBP2479028.1 NAD(P)-dependent dehydrogenase (short-subunit alcohol dehydrogenase family)/pimeloyl-ACP methyl ester carboxylesterase [Crossiella equi]